MIDNLTLGLEVEVHGFARWADLKNRIDVPDSGEHIGLF
jgi:hypothetical protein